MKKKLIIIGCILFCFGCSKDSDTLNYVEANEKIINNNAILIDVGTIDEYNKISDEQLASKAYNAWCTGAR